MTRWSCIFNSVLGPESVAVAPLILPIGEPGLIGEGTPVASTFRFGLLKAMFPLVSIEVIVIL